MSSFIMAPVLAETINYNYTGSITYTSTHSGDDADNDEVTSALRFGDITQYRDIQSVIIRFNAGMYGKNPTWVSRSTSVTYRIGDDVIGTGDLTVTNLYSESMGRAYGVIACYSFDTWNVDEYTGNQNVMCDYGSAYYATWGYNHYSGTPSGNTVLLGYGSDGGYSANIRKGYTIYAYNAVNFHQSLDYEDNGVLLDIVFNREGFTNQVKIINCDGLPIYDNYLGYDIDIATADYPVTVNVTNPFTDTIWTNQIPETASTIPPEQTALISAYVYDSVTGNLINGHNTSTLYYGASLPVTCTWPGGVSHTTLDWNYAQSAQVTYSAPGYETSDTYNWTSSSIDLTGNWLKVGEERDLNVYLMPTGTPTETTAYAQFLLTEDLGYYTFYSENAAVTIGNTTLLSNKAGTCAFELAPGTYSYTVTKTGYLSTSGSFTLGTSNQLIKVKMNKVPTAPTPPGEPGVEYTYSPENYREKADEAATIFTSMLPMWATLAALVLTMSLIGWISPKKRR